MKDTVDWFATIQDVRRHAMIFVFAMALVFLNVSVGILFSGESHNWCLFL